MWCTDCGATFASLKYGMFVTAALFFTEQNMKQTESLEHQWNKAE